MPRQGQTGVVVPVPAADALLARVAERYPDAVREGVPAHVSVLYPFLPAEQCDEQVFAALRSIFEQRAPLSVKFAECHRDEDFVSLRPEPIDGLRELTDAARQRWPDVVPYEGRFEVDPHVTIAMRTSLDTAATIQREVRPELPISAELSEAWLVAFDGRWTLRERFALGG